MQKVIDTKMNKLKSIKSKKSKDSMLEDKLFLMSVLPSLVKLSYKNKLLAQLEIIESIQKYLPDPTSEIKNLHRLQINNVGCQTESREKSPKQIEINKSSMGACIICDCTVDLMQFYGDNDTYGTKENYSDMLLTCYNIEIINKNSNIETEICLNCVETVRKSQQMITKLEMKDFLNLNKLPDIKLEEMIIENYEDNMETNFDEPLSPTLSNSESISAKDEASINVNENNCQSDDDNLKLSYEMPKLDPTDVVCPICKEDFEHNDALNAHYSTHFKMFPCEMCNLKYLTRRSLLQHISRIHVNKKFACKLCKKTYLTKPAVKRHIYESHKRREKYNCLKCSERFYDYIVRNKHMQLVHDLKLKSYHCTTCGKEYNSSSTLSTHIKKTHLRLREHQCDQCDRAFFARSDLSKHMVSHTGSRDFKCEHCGKCYGRKKTLTEHLKIHANLREHVCDVCGKAFIQKCTLKGHMEKHAREKHNN